MGRFFKVLFGLSLALWSTGAHAAASPWWTNDHGRVRLIAASNAVGASGEVRLGIQFEMLAGWKIYWRSPGDAGFPPNPSWQGSDNLIDARIAWPAPQRFEVLGLQTIGYHDEVVFPVTALVSRTGEALKLRAEIPYLTCEEICVPYTASLALDLPPGPESNSPETALIDTYAAHVPRTDGGSGLTLARAEIAGEAGRQVLLLDLAAAAPLSAPDAFIEGPEAFLFGAPKIRIAEDRRSAVMRIPVSPRAAPGESLAGKEILVTLVDGDRAAERSVVPAAALGVLPMAETEPAGIAEFLAMIGIAIIGGLILNLMPCVLPVLSIKLLSVVGHGGRDPGPVRAGFLASALGIVVSFLVLGTVAVALKSGGQAAGWGIQFQQPVFLTALTLIVVLFAANLWGLFEIRLPGWVSDAASAPGTPGGGGHGPSHSLWGHFLTGAFATVLATPCTAPFLGTAVGFALARGAMEIYAIFAALGIGLALPYLAVAAFPGIATRLPRPGAWMIVLKRILGLALIATAIWLLTVLVAQIGARETGMIALLSLSIGVALWQYRHLADRARLATWIVVALLSTLSLLAATTLRDVGRDTRTAVADGMWRPFDVAGIATELRAGRTVFVDVTADWCLTCKANKALVLDTEAVARALTGPDVVAMKADWTNPDPRIAKFLADYGRYGIPFNIVYGPGTPNGEPLPELLTADAVLGALRRAAATAHVSAR